VETPNPSGRLFIEDADVVYLTGDDISWRLPSWRLPISKLRVIGEYTTAEGPHIDDYYLVFVTNEPDHWHVASYYAQADDLFRQNLGVLLGGEIHFGLNRSTEWKHRILWPKALEGYELFQEIPEAKAKNFWEQIRQFVHLRTHLKLSQSAIDEINRKRD